MAGDLLPDAPFVSPGTARYIAKQAAEAAAQAAEAARMVARDRAVIDAIRRAAWSASR